jgi:hypothetical protein
MVVNSGEFVSFAAQLLPTNRLNALQDEQQHQIEDKIKSKTKQMVTQLKHVTATACGIYIRRKIFIVR